MRRILLSAIAVIAMVLTIVSGLIWLERIRMDYNSEGRYFDEKTLVVYDESALIFYGLMTVTPLGLLCAAIIGLKKATARS